MVKYIIQLFVAGLFFCAPPAYGSSQYDTLFVGFDAGETNIWAALLADGKYQKKYALLTMATATKVAKDNQLKPLIEIESLQINCPANNRLYSLSPDDLQKIQTLKATWVCTGMYSTPQRQIAEALHEKGSKIIGVWDNFSPFERLSKDLVANVEKIVAIADRIFTPSTEVANDLNRRFKTDKALSIGQPTLEVWERKIKEIDRSQAIRKTPFDLQKPLLVYISGYEEAGNQYAEAFRLFAESLKGEGEKFNLLIQLHPRSNGDFERQTLEAMARTSSNFPRFFISDSRKNLNTFEAVALSSLGVTHRSTVAIQALFAGKDFLYVDVPGSAYSNFAIEKKLSEQLSKPEEIKLFIRSALDKPSLNLESLYEKSGISPNGTENMRLTLG